jgi:hypothetical protein
MRKFTIATAILAMGVLISAAPASAERINGGAIKQNGQCWNGHGGASEAAWGYWGSCAEKASRGGNGGVVQLTPRRRT